MLGIWLLGWDCKAVPRTTLYCLSFYYPEGYTSTGMIFKEKSVHFVCIMCGRKTRKSFLPLRWYKLRLNSTKPQFADHKEELLSFSDRMIPTGIVNFESHITCWMISIGITRYGSILWRQSAAIRWSITLNCSVSWCLLIYTCRFNFSLHFVRLVP